MTEKDKLLENFVKKSGKKKEEIEKLVADKVNELSGLVSEEGAIYIIANELGVRLDSDRPKREADMVKVENITEPKTPTSMVCKVIRKYDRVNFSTSSGSEGAVQSLLVGDETGIIRVVFWNDKADLLENIHDGDVLKIVNAYTRENTNNERIEVHFGQYSDIEVNPEGVDVELKEFVPTDVDFTEKKVTELEEGDRNVKVAGLITDFEIPRFYLGCPECFKKVYQDEGAYKCAQHDEVEAMRIPIVNMIIDDGSGSIAVVGFRDRAESLTKEKTDDILGLAEDIDKYRSFSKKMIGSKVELGGNVSLSSMTGDKQVLVNQVINLDIQVGTVDEIADELVAEAEDVEAKEEPKKEEKVEEESVEVEEVEDAPKEKEVKEEPKEEKKEEKKPAAKKEEPKKEEKKEEKKKEVVDDDDDLDLDIEEIDFDDDLM